MNLFDVTLDLGRFAQGTADYVITQISGNRIYCDNLSGRVAEYGGGTIWFRSGNSAGKFGRIKSALANAIDLQDTYPDGVNVGDQITIGSWLEFDTQKLINAINSVLQTYKILMFDGDFTFDREGHGVDLADMTDDVRKVIWWDERNNVAKTCHYWRVRSRTWLDIMDGRLPDGAPLGIYYVRTHGPVSKDEPEIDDQVDPLYLRYMAWLYLCRNLIQNTHKDNLISTDMYNEAKIYERDYGTRPNKKLIMKDFTFPAW